MKSRRAGSLPGGSASAGGSAGVASGAVGHAVAFDINKDRSEHADNDSPARHSSTPPSTALQSGSASPNEGSEEGATGGRRGLSSGAGQRFEEESGDALRAGERSWGTEFEWDGEGQKAGAKAG